MRVGWALLLLYAWRGAAEVPECLGFDYNFEHGCANNFNSDLNDAFEMRVGGDTGRMSSTPRLLNAYCTKKNYALLSEHCGVCRYTLTITEPKQYADIPICITPPVLKSLVPGAMMDLGHPMNGKEVNIVRTLKQPFNQGDRASYGCSADDWPARSELEGQIALTMYPLRGGCGLTTTWPHAGDKGAGLFISVIDLVHFFYESLPPPISRTLTGSAKRSPGFLMMGHPYIMDVLALPANATVRGRVDFANCGKTSEERLWQNEDLSQAYLTNCMHFMGPFLKDLCKGVADELCTTCELPLYKSRASYERNETSSCMYGEDLIPYRSRMFFQANYELPGEIVVLNGGTEARCKEADWSGLRGKTVMISAGNHGPCTRLTQIEAASRAGVRGLIIRSSHALFGRLTDTMNVSVSFLRDHAGLLSYAKNASHHDGVDPASGLPFIRMYVGPGTAKPAAPPPVTDANPLPTVEKDTDTLLDESGALAAVVLVPILTILIVVKVVHGVQYSKKVIGSIQGVPLFLGSTVLTLSCVVLLCIATYAMTESAGSDATNSAFENNRVNMAYSNTRNGENVRRLTRDLMLELSRAFKYAGNLEAKDVDLVASAIFANGPFYSRTPFRTYATWEEVVQGAAEAWTSRRLLVPDGVVGLNHWWKPALFANNGYYWDSVGLRTNPTQLAKEGSIWSDPTKRDVLVNARPGQTGSIDPATVENMTVAETNNGLLYDLVTDSKMCEMSFSRRYTAAEQRDANALTCDTFTAKVHVDGLAVPRTGSYDPLKWAHTSHMPAAPPGQAPYRDLMDMWNRRVTGLIYSKYQMQHTTLPDGTFQDTEYAKTYHTYLRPADDNGHADFGLNAIVSMPSERLERQTLAAVTRASSDAEKVSLLANTTFLYAIKSTNLIYVSNRPRTQIVDMVKNRVQGRDGVRIGTRTFDLTDSNHIPTNAVGAYINTELYKTNATFRRGTEYVFELDQLDHYHAVSSILMYFSFDSGDGDNSGENWDTRTLRLTPGAAGDITYNLATPALTGGRYGSAMQFDGFTMVSISPYLTVRVPRVWAARSFAGTAADVADATAYRGVPAWGTVYPFDHYRKAETFRGVEGVIVCERDYVSGETGAPYLRDRFEFNQDFSVSLYVRPEAGTGVFGTSRGAQRLFSDATGFALDGTFALYADGVMQLGFSTLRTGCRTQAIGGAVPEGEWTFLVATINRETRVCSVFANGRHVSSGNMSELYESSTVYEQNYTIGEGFVGAVDEVRVHRLALDEHDAMHLYNTYTEHAHDAVRDGRNITVADVSVRSRMWTVTYDSLYTHQVLMTPTEDILRETNAITNATSALVQEQEDRTAKTKTRKNDEALLVVTILALLVMLLFLILNDFVTRPFTQFAHAIQGVAYMHVSEVSGGGSSLLMEVRVMSRAMDMLVENMKEYKTYMPLSMLGQVQSEGDSDGDVDTASNSTHNQAKSRRSSTGTRTESCLSSQLDRVAMMQRLRAGLHKKKASFAVCNLKGFNTVASSKPTTETVATHSEYVTRVVDAAESLRGVPEQFCGDRIYVFFNGAKVCAAHTTNALSFGEMVRLGWDKTEETSDCKVNIAVTTGEVRAGNIGSATMRRYSCVGWPVSWCFLLERYGRASGIALVTDQCLYEVAQTLFVMRHHSFVLAGHKNRCMMVTAVMGVVDKGGDDEWMYELEKAKEQNPHNTWNRACEAAFGKDLAAFKIVIAELSAEESEAASQLVSMGRESLELVTRRVDLSVAEEASPGQREVPE